ncbi:MAG: hypothetical protein JO112_01030 [Planctomycetes bacterium]|nr:hypothetical protein [Planctomycetota bacterium]
MKTLLALLLALAPALLAGCGGGSSPRPPSLSSPDPAERLEAVRHAQEKYGAHPGTDDTTRK